MKRIYPLIILLFAICMTTGCTSILQTSVKIQEDRVFNYYPEPQKAVEAYDLNGTLYVKCPLAKYTYRNSWFYVCIAPSAWGGKRSRFAGYCDPAEYVWIYRPYEKQVSLEEQLGRCVYLSFQYDPAEQDLDEKLKTAKKISIESIEHPMLGYNYGGSFFAEHSDAFLPQIRQESENGFWWTSLAVLDGILIDFPVSLVMTATGSFWYIPLTDL